MNKPWEQLADGETWRGVWETGFSTEQSQTALPVLAARGHKSGPTLLITGGVHGDEYEGPAAIYTLFDRLDPSRLAGTVIGVPVVNVWAWEARSRVSPGDGVNLNRAFGIHERTGPSYTLAGVVFDHLIRCCDALIDLHSGGVALDHLPMIGWYAGGSGRAEEVARRFGTALHPWLIPDVPGVLSYETHRIGKIALGAEWRGGGRLDPAGAEAYTEGIRRTMTALEMIPTDTESDFFTLDTRSPVAGNYQHTETAGLFCPCVRLGDSTTAGAELGTLYDLLGTPSAKITAARNGIVAGLPNLARLNAGDIVAYIG